MKHLPYGHSPNRTLAETLLRAIRRRVPVRMNVPPSASGREYTRGRLIVAFGWILALAVQAALLIALAELVEIIHGVMSLYLDLAQQQLDLTSLYVSATGPE